MVLSPIATGLLLSLLQLGWIDTPLLPGERYRARVQAAPLPVQFGHVVRSVPRFPVARAPSMSQSACASKRLGIASNLYWSITPAPPRPHRQDPEDSLFARF